MLSLLELRTGILLRGTPHNKTNIRAILNVIPKLDRYAFYKPSTKPARNPTVSTSGPSAGGSQPCCKESTFKQTANPAHDTAISHCKVHRHATAVLNNPLVLGEVAAAAVEKISRLKRSDACQSQTRPTANGTEGQRSEGKCQSHKSIPELLRMTDDTEYLD